MSMSSEQHIVNEVLAFLQHAIDTMDEISIIQIAKSNFKYEEIVSAKTLLFQSVGKIDQMPSRRKDEKGEKSLQDKVNLLKSFVCTGVWSCYFSFGLMFGSPTVFIAQIRREANSTDAVSIQMASWLSSTYSYSGTLNTLILTFLARLMGRKLTYLVVDVTTLIGCIVFYFSTTLTHLLISEVIHGCLTASQMTVSLMILTECTSPQYRGIFMTLKSATFFWGIWVANTIGTFMHWRNIAIPAFVCSVYSLLTCILSPESPYWLASKHKFEDCTLAHEWLKGSSKESKAELETLIESRKNYMPSSAHNKLRKIVNVIMSEKFYKPNALLILLLLVYNFSGKIVCGMYSLDIIKRITKTESTAYSGMLILDGITVLGMYVGCGLSKIYKRRTLLLVSCSIGVAILFCISVYLHLINFGIFVEDTYVSISLLMAYSLTMSVGPMIMCTTILGELIPIKYRSSSVLLMGFSNQLITGVTLKISPFLLNYFGIHGLFSFFAICELLLLIITYKVLPETKDKTLLEIQENLLG